MNVKRLIFVSLFFIGFTTSAKGKEFTFLKVYEKVDRAGKIQDGGAQDLEKVLSKGIMDEFKNDNFFNS